MSEISWKMVFDGWAPIMRSLVIGIAGYFFLVAILRISGKRTLSKMNAFDLVVTVAFGSTLASMLTSNNVSLVQGMVALSLLVLLQFFNTFLAVRFEWYQGLIKAQPTLVFFKGNFLVDALRKQRLSQEEVLAAMRQQGAASPSDVDAVVLETEGSLSVMRQGADSTEKLARLGVDVRSNLGAKRAAATTHDRPD